ncbi:MAG TPA: IclR family transcriptional regulator [Paracoccus sp. (in: a-proteobacteria)]|uniref:IclR family transcriptional regulator n=1 Tax=Paracoccus sp. TaxID=267 RepID=UPI002C96E9D1|nr:IclR family transcriptional regulator [Paracoccus sp. (in: a-proteobacteria)]HWL59038.1 IclR family transcriptional regulator [Paracoccus sp. (in: a-proteobacteria)]
MKKMDRTTDSGEIGKDRVEAVERAIALLQCFTEPGESLTLSALAQRSGFYKSTILRLAGSLRYTGLLERDIEGRYRLGPELHRLSELSRAKFTLEGLIRPTLQRLSAETQETASFYVRDGEERICLYRVNSPRSVRHHLEEGTRHPLATGAAGLLLTWHGDSSDHPSAAELRVTGTILSRGGRNEDLAAVAAPITNTFGELVGSLSVSGLISRFTDERVDIARELLKKAADELRPRLPRPEPGNRDHGDGKADPE